MHKIAIIKSSWLHTNICLQKSSIIQLGEAPEHNFYKDVLECFTYASAYWDKLFSDWNISFSQVNMSHTVQMQHKEDPCPVQSKSNTT